MTILISAIVATGLLVALAAWMTASARPVPLRIPVRISERRKSQQQR